MISLDAGTMFQEYCRLTKQWGLFVIGSMNETSDDGTIKVANFLNIGNEEHSQIIMDECGYFFFDSEEECYNHYERVVGDDGPSESNPYNGPDRCYAMTVNPNGVIETENT